MRDQLISYLILLRRHCFEQISDTARPTLKGFVPVGRLVKHDSRLGLADKADSSVLSRPEWPVVHKHLGWISKNDLVNFSKCLQAH